MKMCHAWKTEHIDYVFNSSMPVKVILCNWKKVDIDG